MKVLLASFHFGSTSAAATDTSFVVAYVYCESHRVSVEPVHQAFEGSPIIRQLRELTEIAGDDAYSILTNFNWPFWSFDDAKIH